MYRANSIWANKVFFLLLLVSFSGICQAQLSKYVFEQNKMGSPFRILMYCNDSLKAVALANEAFGLVDKANAVFSDYDSSSELSRLNRSAGKGKYVPVSALLFDLLVRSKSAFFESRFAFDPSIGPLSMVWRKIRRERKLSLKSIVDAKKLVGYNRVIIDESNKKVLLPVKGMSIDFGGVAKGYIADLVLKFLSQKGIASALVDAGGDISVGNAPPGTDGWIVGIGIPEEKETLLSKKLFLQNIAVATSGSTYQYFEHEGKKYSHIIDPRTGYGITSPRNVTVIAPQGWIADWLATACSILAVDKAMELAERNHAELLIAESDKGQLKYYSTKGFYSFWK